MRRVSLRPGHDWFGPSGLSRRGLLRRALTASGLALAGQTVRPGLLAAAPRGAPTPVPDWDVPGGHFYTQGAPDGAPADSGYVVTDADDIAFWAQYQALGGPAQLGYPVTSRYVDGTNAYQVMQAAVLRWIGKTGGADLHPVFAALSQLDLDDWLEARGVPRPAPALHADPGLPEETRLSWLTQPLLRTAYEMTSPEASRRRFGLPMSEPQRFGPYIAQRFERAALQLWVDATPDMPAPGAVTVVQVGDLLKEANLVPDPASAPQPAPAPRPAVVEQPKPQVVPVVAPAAGGGGRSVVVNLSQQWWYAYEDGQAVFSGPVTTGMPELPTPTGYYTIFARRSPYTMYSPWPPGNKFYYPPSSMTYAMQITGSGVFLHDAPWRPYYGPGTNVPHGDPDGGWRTGSHGCINLPFGAAQWLWNWSSIGTPVRVTY